MIWSAFHQNTRVGKEMPDTMFFYSSESELKSMEMIYQYLQLDLLTNPECSLLSNATALTGACTFNRDQNTLPKTFRDFRKETFAVDWDACLCVAGTEKSDQRRVVLNYSKEMKVIVVNFPSAASGFTQNELRIKEWLERELRGS